MFLASEQRTLPNHAMVNAAQFRIDDLGDEDGSSSDAIWCQAAPSLGVVHYQWYGPGGLVSDTTPDVRAHILDTIQTDCNCTCNSSQL